MVETVSRTICRIRARWPRENQQQQLFHRVRGLLRANRASQASQLFLADLDRQLLRASPQPGDRCKQQADDWLWRTAVLFRSYNQPDLALRLFTQLKTRLPVPIEALVSALQASSDLVWKAPEDPHQPSIPLTPNAFDHLHHSQLANSLLDLANHPLLLAQKPSPKLALPGHHPQINHSQQHDALPSSPQKKNTRALEVILANILKLGDMDWIVSIFRDFYPAYTDQLGRYLYPTSPSPSSSSSCSCSRTTASDGLLSVDEIPSGRLVKYLVSGYMACKDVRRAYLVVRFHGRMVDRVGRDVEEGDLTTEVTFLRLVSRTSVGSMECRMGMVVKVLERMREGMKGLDSYGVEGLMEMRYRMRAGWAFRRRQEATLAILAAVLDRALALFLLHRARPSSFPSSNSNALIHGPHQGQHAVSSWKYRPSPALFGILLRALRDLLRFQTRPLPRPPSLSLHHHQQHDHTLPLEVPKTAKKRRPSPGLHRALLAQILAFDHLNRSICPSPPKSSSINGRPNQQDPAHTQEEESLDRLPIRLDLLPPKTVMLLVECLLLARDYVALWVLLNRPSLSTDIRRQALPSITKTRRILQLNSPSPSSLLESQLLQQLDPLHSIRLQLAHCFTLDFSAVHRSLRWETEERAIHARILAEIAKLDRPFLHSFALSQFSLEFLRKEFGKEQLDLLSYGMSYDTTGAVM
ncbi:hypothetical protein PGT21_021808 [Puccinia graminis f. sp. tritici]|uniref:Uncharacterized protein n=1 Tax=Puccinia graminis f. sp. tritici TaxID=56615 RepID=A0A5B0N3E1_PUCGR|nr:hypothetical protein PGT21_021808 [Puccinia graminis f. sp. tritici]KAA1124093.1 hypothetical protein PGTUg99_026978 [Puccinia graminis f. sp. tritici]